VQPVYYFYLDESNLPRIDKINPSSPFFIMGGVVVDDSNYAPICTSITGFKARQFPSLANFQFKMHASDLINCRGSFSGIDADCNRLVL
jgi:hypothetical protein